MHERSHNFVKAVLGEDGAAAIHKAAAQSPTFEHAVLPRTILGWLEVATTFEYEGQIPGVEGTHVSFKKSDGSFSGKINLDGGDYAFDKASAMHVAAGIAVALGATPEQVAEGVRNVDIARLGKSIDLLAKTNAALGSLAKKETRYCTACRDPLDKDGHCKVKSHWPLLDKAQEGPGQTAKPISATPPAAPTRSQPGQQPPRRQQLPRPSGIAKSMRVTKSQASAKCPMCQCSQFTGDQFTGCFCTMALAKSVQVRTEPGAYVLSFGKGWDREAIVTLQELFGSK